MHRGAARLRDLALGQYPVGLMGASPALVLWVFNVVEVVGYSGENPFENDTCDVSMTAICRGIETDLRELLSETELPLKIKAVDGVL